VLQLAPDANYFDTRGHIFEALGRREEAIADFRRALTLDLGIEESKEALKRLGASR
jgi:tetratricopeptide (TPR) repeat protein